MTLNEIKDAHIRTLPLNIGGSRAIVVGSTCQTVISSLYWTFTVRLDSGKYLEDVPVTFFRDVTIWKEKEEMTNQNDKIMELIKAVLDHKIIQYKSPVTSWEDSELQKSGRVLQVIEYILMKPYTYRIKPETKKITTRNWLTRDNILETLLLDNDGTTEADVEACCVFKQWLDPEPRVYEVEV